MSNLSSVTPYALAMLLCDAAITDADTGKKSLIGIYDQFQPPGFPRPHLFTIYTKITDAEGLYTFTIEYVSISSGRKLLQIETDPLPITSRLEAFELVLKLAVDVPEPGKYEFRLSANGAYVSSVMFIARALTQEVS